MILNLAIFGSDSGSFCSDLREWFLDEIEAFAVACPLGTWFQLFNGPETTRVCGQFDNVPWDYTPDSMHTVDPPNSNPAANRSWALNTFSPAVTMPSVEQDYIDLEEAFWADARERVRAAGHPPERLLFWGIHSYVLATSTGLVRSLGAPDPLDFTTVPENAVFSEFGIGRYPDVELNDPTVLPRPFREHVGRILAKVPRAMYLHTPIDSRRYGQWEIVGGTLELWTELMYKTWLLDPPGRNPLANVAYHLLEDEPYLYSEMIDAARRFGDLKPIRLLP